MIRHVATLSDAVKHYCLLRPLEPKAEYQIRHSVDLLQRWAARPLRLEELTETLLSEFVKSLESKLSRRSVINHRANCLSVWNAAADAGLCEYPRPRLVRRLKKPKPRPKAWTLEELRRVLAAAESLDGVTARGIRRCVYFPCLIHVGYETGLRRLDLWRLKRDDVASDGRVSILQHKTGEQQICQLTPQTAERFFGIPGREPLAWPSNEKTYYAIWKRLCAAANVPHGATHCVRRTGATHLHLRDPEAVQQYLGHATPEMRWHYIDRSHGARMPPQPPAIGAK